MREIPVDKISRQFEIISSSCEPFLLKECIEPEKTERKITYKNEVKQNINERSLKSQKLFNYCKQYVAFFRSRSFEFLFIDYSLGRFVYEFDDRDFLISSNLYWNPCPLNMQFIKEIGLSGLDVMEYIDNIADKEKLELDQISLRTPIRLDYIREYNDKNIEYHPQWHMHYQHKDTRAKTQNMLSLYSYILFILENCYPLIYQAKEHEEKIDMLRKLERESIQGFKVRKSVHGIYGNKIHTVIGLEH